jgi:hypothetical protein
MKKQLFVLLFVLVLATVMVVPAGAWNGPIVTPLCAPDSTNFAFKVTLTQEENYKMQWSWNTDFSGATAITLNMGDNTVIVPRGTHKNDLWYIRYVSDTGSVGSAKANGDLCNPTPPTPPSYTPPNPVGLTLWVYTNYSLGFNVSPGNFGPDGGCLVYGIGVLPTSPSVGIPYCDGGPFQGNNAYIKVYSGWVTLPYPGTQQCWGPKLANGCEGDIALAKLNAEHGWHLTYKWFFHGYGGH